MGLTDKFKAAHAAIHHTDGRVELGQSAAFGAEPGQAADLSATASADNTLDLGQP